MLDFKWGPSRGIHLYNEASSLGSGPLGDPSDQKGKRNVSIGRLEKF